MANSTADSSFSTYGLENELSDYKSISGSAIFSVIMGGLSSLMFVDWGFAFIPVLAILFGLLAMRNIKRAPDLYAGQKIAQAGIGLGFLFSLLAVASGLAFDIMLKNDANAYAATLADTLKTARPEDLMFLRIPPSQRGDLTPDKSMAERLASSGREGKMGIEQEMAPLRNITEAVKKAGGKVDFDRVERVGYDKLTPYAVTVYSVTLPQEEHDHKPGEEHDHSQPELTGKQQIMVLIKADRSEGGRKWYLTEMAYPYKSGTAQIKAEAIDDGHGHGGGGHSH